MTHSCRGYCLTIVGHALEDPLPPVRALPGLSYCQLLQPHTQAPSPIHNPQLHILHSLVISQWEGQ